MGDTGIEIIDLAELSRRYEAGLELYKLPPRNPQHPSMAKHDAELGYVDIYWGGYEYSIPLADLSTPEDVMWKIHHVSKKRWEHMTPKRVSLFIGLIAHINGWKPYGAFERVGAELTVRTTSNTEERALLTPKLRYEVLKRDNFQCRACGASPETGAHLHIDHVTAIANGGRTVFNNLQALCSPCNYGKGASK